METMALMSLVSLEKKEKVNGIPSGGTAGQVLKKKSGTDYDTEWAADSAGTTVTIDGTLTQTGQAADAKATGDALALKLAKPSGNGNSGQILKSNGDGTTDWMNAPSGSGLITIDDTLTQTGQAADAKAVGDLMVYTVGQIETGLDGIAYSADESIARITPQNGATTSMDIWVCGKNLLEPAKMETGKGLYDDGHVEANASSICSDYLPLSLEVGDKLFLQFAASLASTNGSARFAFYNASKTKLAYKQEWFWSGKTPNVGADIPSGAKYVRVALQGMYDQSSSAADFLSNNTVMLAYGSSAATYAAYSGSHVTFSVSQQNVDDIEIPSGGQAVFPELCDVTFGVAARGETVSEIIENAPVNTAFKASKIESGSYVGTPGDIAQRFVTNRKTGASVTISDALECRAISCTCNSDITVKGTNLLPCGSTSFTFKSPWYELDSAMESGDYTLTLSASADAEDIASFTMILSSSTSESAASQTGLLAYRTIPISSGTYAVKVSSLGAHKYVQFYYNSQSVKISIVNPMFVKGWDGENVPYQKYLKPRAYSPSDLYLKDQPIILTAGGDSIDVTYIVKTDYVGTLMYGVSGGVVSSGGNTATPEEYGAVGDGVTDDSAAVQAAIDSGAKIINLNGNYNLGTTGIVITGDGKRFTCLGTLTYTGSGAAVTAKGCTHCRFVFDTIISTGDCLWVTVDSTENSWYCDYEFSEFSAGSSGACIKITRSEFPADVSDKTKSTLSEQRFHGGQCKTGAYGIYADLLYDDNLEQYPGSGWYNEGSYMFYNIGFEIVGLGIELHSIRCAMFMNCRAAEQQQKKLYNTQGVINTYGLCNNLIWFGYDTPNGSLSDRTYGIIYKTGDMQMPVYGIIYCGEILPLQRMFTIPSTASLNVTPYVSNGVCDLNCAALAYSREPQYLNTPLRNRDHRMYPSVVELATGTHDLVLPYYFGDMGHTYIANDIYTQRAGFLNDMTVYFKNGANTDHLTVWKTRKNGSYEFVADIPASEVDFSQYGVKLSYGGRVIKWTYEKFALNPTQTPALPFYINDLPDAEISVLFDEEPVLRVGSTGESCAYQWQISTDSGSTWTDISGATSAAYTPTLTAQSVGNKYRCAVTSGGVTITSDPTTITDTNIGASAHAQAGE